MKIFLIGFMGSGKTTLGRKLASKLGYAFVDLDKKIENQSGMTVSGYFQQYGEHAFRLLEQRVLQENNFDADAVIATGGGTPCYFDNMQWMNTNGITVYLSLPPKVLAYRLENSKKTERPLIHDMRGEELIHFISTKLAEREVFYNQAKFIVSGKDITAEKLAGYLQMVK